MSYVTAFYTYEEPIQIKEKGYEGFHMKIKILYRGIVPQETVIIYKVKMTNNSFVYMRLRWQTAI